MVWTRIKKIEQSKYNNSSIAIFDFNGQEKFTIISSKVLRYLKVDELRERDKIFVIKTFNSRNNKELYIIKKVKRENDKNK